MPGTPQLTFVAAHVDEGPGASLAQAMRDEIAIMYDGLDLDGDSMPRAGPAELRPPGGAFIVGHLGPESACCGGIKRLDDRTCEMKKMYVVPALRGRGVGRALLHELEARARSAAAMRSPVSTPAPSRSAPAACMSPRATSRSQTSMATPSPRSGARSFYRHGRLERDVRRGTRGSRSRSCRRRGTGRRAAGGGRGRS